MIIPEDRQRMQRACEVARKSIHSKCKVGAVIYARYPDDMNCEVASSFNKIKEEIQYQNVTVFDEHAEARMLWGMTHFLPSSEPTLYSTKAVCLECARCIQAKGIRRVVMARPYEPSKWSASQKEAIEYLQKSGVKVDFLDIKMVDGCPYLAEAQRT
ncbi:deoxycytidylate deaminase [Caudoviricetes sp.]|nr:deoxycytidylate deaminase [Caudoviricetes sp.]